MIFTSKKTLIISGITLLSLIIFSVFIPSKSNALSDIYGDKIFDTGNLKPVDSELKVKTGENAPDFTLETISGTKITLSQFQGKKNVLLSFIPAAWTPVCSDQWPGYNIAKPLFDKHDTILLGISVDNLPTLFAWTKQMGELWFEVLSDFWPHGAVADSFGILRSDGTAERGLFLIDKQGIIRFIHVGDINVRPDLGIIVKAMENLEP
ncbi:Thioredoxin peroxidase [Desulfamplus magnetovallimortis]|uniref:Thioredoxin peroxidase n=1 Tax=Desulfamplus magnetovallimortis TaxID=1246637 RepID=A0A1W1HFN9_9BACT|nr:peroxiredoxin [Desulfamplus magnetovallimortis]SLM31246.1 Thioredoxin peroxidase [Desulfamplus magnetovallimortis]